MTSHIPVFCFFLAALAAFGGCQGFPSGVSSPSSGTKGDALSSGVLETGKSLLGKKYGTPNVLVAGRRFTLDCIGLVSAAYWGAGMDITVDFAKYAGNGVSRLFRSLENRGALRDGRVSEVGDIVFWDNTWDANGNGKFGDDPLTHAGIVMEVESDGTIHYLHASVFSGVTIERMNLNRPGVSRDENGKLINSPLYMASWVGNKKNPPRFLAGDLFKAYGSFRGARSFLAN